MEQHYVFKSDFHDLLPPESEIGEALPEKTGFRRFFELLLPFLVCSTIFLVALLCSGCLYGLLAGGKTLKEALRLALLLGIAKPQRTVPAALLCYGFLSVAVLAFPISGMYLVILGFSLPCMIGNFFLRVILGPYIE